METKETKLKRLIEQIEPIGTDEAYRVVFAHTELWLFERDLEMLDKFLEMVNPHRFTHYEVPIAILRSGSRARGELPSWSGLFERVCDMLAHRNKNPTRLLRGLL